MHWTPTSQHLRPLLGHVTCATTQGPMLSRAHTQTGPMLGLILCCHNLEILNNLIFELVFCKWIPTGQLSMWAEEKRTVCVSSALPGSLSACCVHKCPVRTEFRKDQGTREFSETQSEHKIGVSSLWLSKMGEGSSDCPKWRHFRSNQKLLSTQKESSGASRNINHQGTLSYPFLFTFLLRIHQLLLLKVMIDKELERVCNA